MMYYSICPQHIVDDSLDECQALIDAAATHHGFAHLAVGFVTREFGWKFPKRLSRDCQTIPVAADQGMMGLALHRDRPFVYPDDPETTDVRVVFGMPPVREIVAPVHYNSLPAAVLLIDVHEGEEGAALDADILRDQAAGLAAELGLVLESHPLAERTLRATLEAVVEDCLRETRSKRGYIAVKLLDGALEYFSPRNPEDTFLPLRANQGLCGKAFRTGEIVNPESVMEDAEYIPSDLTINTELIVPIKNGIDTVGIINLEREETGKYPSRSVRYVVAQADRLRPAVDGFRKLAGDGDPWGTVVLEIIDYAGQHDIEGFGQFLRARLKAKMTIAFDVEDVLLSRRGEPGYLAFGDVLPDYRGRAGMREIEDGRWILYAPITTVEQDWCLIGMIFRTMPSEQMRIAMEHVCWIASQTLEVKRQEHIARRFEGLLRYLSLKRDDYRLHEAVRVISEVASAGHCTIYARSRVNSLEFLGLAASTSQTIFVNSSYREMLYRLGPPYDGLTGFVGTTGETIIEDDLAATTQEYWDRRVAPGFDWRKGMVEREEPRDDIGAFICHPIRYPPDNRVIGVLRLFRNKALGGRATFDALTRTRVSFLCESIGAAYGAQGLISTDYRFGVVA